MKWILKTIIPLYILGKKLKILFKPTSLHDSFIFLFLTQMYLLQGDNHRICPFVCGGGGGGYVFVSIPILMSILSKGTNN